MRRFLLAVALFLGATTARAQIPLPRDTALQIGMFYPRTSPGFPSNFFPAANLFQQINVRDYGAAPVSLGVAFQSVVTATTAAIQSAINAACVQAADPNAPPVVVIPAGKFPINSAINIPCSHLTIRGAGAGLLGTQLIWQILSAGQGPMMTLGPTFTGAAISDVLVEDMTLSGFGSNFPTGGIDFVSCTHCHINRVTVTGYTSFAFRFRGAASTGTGGNAIVSDCQVQSGQSNSFAFVTVTQGGTTGGPDKTRIINCLINTPVAGATGAGWVSDSLVAGGTTGTSPATFMGNVFVANDASSVTAITGTRLVTRFIGNSFEQTGAGGLAVSLSNSITNDPTAVFVGNNWACGAGGCTYTDNGTTKALRALDVFGGGTNPTAPGILFSDATATASGAGSPATLKTFTVPANTVNLSGSTFLHVRVWGHTANNANAKTVSVLYGATSLITLTLTASAVDNWSCDLTLGNRTTGSAAQSVGGMCWHSSTPTLAGVTSATPTLDFTAATAVATQVTQVAAADVTQDGALYVLCGAVGSAGC